MILDCFLIKQGNIYYTKKINIKEFRRKIKLLCIKNAVLEKILIINQAHSNSSRIWRDSIQGKWYVFFYGNFMAWIDFQK